MGWHTRCHRAPANPSGALRPQRWPGECYRDGTMNPLGRSLTVLGLAGLTYACSSMVADSAFAPDGNTSEDSGASRVDGGALGASPSLQGPIDNAVILVHAAKSQPFRLCFEKELDRRPQPDSQTMPEANVVGVEVGSAVRLGPLRGAPGTVWLFDEPLIRAFYPTFGGAGAGPTCQDLLTNSALSGLAVNLGAIDANLSQGVHLLVVRGCPADGPLRTFSAAECGAGWSPTTHNLSVSELTLNGTTRPDTTALPAQIVNLSQALESARAGRELVVSFGALTAADLDLAAIATNPPLFGAPVPGVPARLAYDATDAAVYDSVGVRVRLVAPGDGGASTSTRVLDEALANIQRSSAPRDIPPTFYAVASNYALLVLGDPSPKLPDGGADTDERRALHLLAIPVVEPNADAGADGGPADLDAGTAR
jgi:hypothetical protein